MKKDDFDTLPLDERFIILLHKKIMNKAGSNRRRMKKYYTDQYQKTGVIPAPLLLAQKGIMEGRKCSGRRQVLDTQVKKRFIQMVKASSDPGDDRFIFVTQRGRTIKNYHFWLEHEFNYKISIQALRRFARKQGLKAYLDKPDFEDQKQPDTCFKQVPVFDLIQIDGCRFHYLKIRGRDDRWQRPQVIEVFDTGSRYMFTLDGYFSESNENSIHIMSQFLLSTPFPKKKFVTGPIMPKDF